MNFQNRKSLKKMNTIEKIIKNINLLGYKTLSYGYFFLIYYFLLEVYSINLFQIYPFTLSLLISGIVRVILSCLMILGAIFIYRDYKRFYIKNKEIIFKNTIRWTVISIICGCIGLIGLFIPFSLEYSGGPIYLTCVYFDGLGNIPLIFHSLIWLLALAGGIFTWISLYLRSKLINNKNSKINESKVSNRKSQDEYLYHLKGISIILIYFSLAIHMLIYIYLLIFYVARSYDGIPFNTILTNAFTTIILTSVIMKSGDLIIKNHYLGNKICIIGGIIGVIGTFVPIQVINGYPYSGVFLLLEGS
ncbi:MAG: hypothetical protein ACTSPQ_16780 [Candidatus Helarchaeota archaeon]